MKDFARHLNADAALTRKLVFIFFGIPLIVGLATVSPAQPSESRITFANSIKELSTVTANAATVAKNIPTIVRSQLTEAETEATIDFSIALKMWNLAEL